MVEATVHENSADWKIAGGEEVVSDDFGLWWGCGGGGSGGGGVFVFVDAGIGTHGFEAVAAEGEVELFGDGGEEEGCLAPGGVDFGPINLGNAC